uniref:FAAP20 FANCA interaction domain-containing protein n=1 Tax=Mus spicilegus TaxID=10103 RepID=A0A8C6HG40_MUSSI
MPRLTFPMLPRPPNCRPWFLSEGSKSEPWAALLRSTVSGTADWTPNHQPLPPLPAFPSQESLPDPESTVPPEAFTVGSKTFSWTPLPPALRGSGSPSHLFCEPEGSLGSPTPSLKGCPALNSGRTPSTQECVPVQSPLVLLSCPLCQKAFDPKMAFCVCCPWVCLRKDLKTGPLKRDAPSSGCFSIGCMKAWQSALLF